MTNPKTYLIDPTDILSSDPKKMAAYEEGGTSITEEIIEVVEKSAYDELMQEGLELVSSLRRVSETSPHGPIEFDSVKNWQARYGKEAE